MIEDVQRLYGAAHHDLSIFGVGVTTIGGSALEKLSDSDSDSNSDRGSQSEWDMARLEEV